MSLREIPIPQDRPHFRLLVTLDEVDCSFEFHFNSRDEHWYFNLSTYEGEMVVSSVKVVAGVDFFAKRHNDSRIPMGSLYVSATPTEDNFGTEIKLYYGAVLG